MADALNTTVDQAPEEQGEASVQSRVQTTMAEMLAQKQATHKESQQPEPNGQDDGPPEPGGKAESDTSDKSVLDAENLANTGNPVLDAGISMMQEVAGLNKQDVERILSTAFERGDASLVDVNYIKERFGKHAEYVEKLAKAYIEHTTEQAQGIIRKIHEQAGGEEQWNLMNQAFHQHAPAALQKAVQALAESEDYEGAASLILEFSRGSGLVPVQGKHIRGGGSVANGALSADGFKEELAKLRKIAGNRSFDSGPIKAQYDALVRRRQAGRAQGF